MNLSLQVEDDLQLEGEDEERFEMEREEHEKVSSRSEVPDIPAGRFRPDFMARVGGDSIVASILQRYLFLSFKQWKTVR